MDLDQTAANILKIVSAEFIRSAVASQQFLRDGRPQVAFVGRSNVGKSSLMNRLLKRKGLARTSGTPGRTRAVNYFLINGKFYFVDLPGYGYAKAGWKDRQSWADLMDQYFRAALPAAQILQLVDSKVGATRLDEEGYEYLKSFGATITVAATKIDRLPRGRRPAALAEIRRALQLDETVKTVAVSARDGDGIQELWREILHNLDPGSREPNEDHHG